MRLQHRRAPETHPHTTTDAVGGVRGKIPIFSFFPSFFFSLVDDDAAAHGSPLPPSLLLCPSLVPSTTRRWGRRLQLKRAIFKSSPFACEIYFAAAVQPSHVTLPSAAEQYGPGRAGRKRLFWIKRQLSHRLFFFLS